MEDGEPATCSADT